MKQIQRFALTQFLIYSVKHPRWERIRDAKPSASRSKLYEVVAFCNWLSEQINMEVELPTEAKWERAARHTDGRIYPWGNEEGLERHYNVYDTGIGSTSVVGIFPSGKAVCGKADMLGNMWEWCNTQ